MQVRDTRAKCIEYAELFAANNPGKSFYVVRSPGGCDGFITVSGDALLTGYPENVVYMAYCSTRSR